jgi:PHD/YefM family antitoxin component YafN of YafNO toxin-antitoxin module
MRDTRVSSAEFLENYGALTDKTLSEPVTITRNGRDELVLLSADEYARLKRRDRRVIAAGELTDAERELIAKAEVPPEFAHLDDELEDHQR